MSEIIFMYFFAGLEKNWRKHNEKNYKIAIETWTFIFLLSQ